MARITVPTSGTWSTITTGTFDPMFQELYQNPVVGVYDYNDLDTQTTPINISAPATWFDITNDGLGPNTNTTYALPSAPDIWTGGVTNRFDFSSLDLGDTVDIRLDLVMTTSSNNQDVDVDIVLGAGPGEYRLPFITEQNYKTAGPHQLLRFSSVYMGDVNTRDNPARFQIRSSNTGTLLVNGWYCRVIKRAIEVV